MRIFDGHCDVLSKMVTYPKIGFESEEVLDVSYGRLRKAGVKIQLFAMYLSENWNQPGFRHLLEMADLFYEKIIRPYGIVPIRTKDDLRLVAHGGPESMGALLTLEGADGLEGSLVNLRTLFRLGVRCLGITWNDANWAADGVREPRNGGFTEKGRELVRECDRLGIILDVSHLSDRGFWELTGLTQRPFIASHSNAFAVCPHPRNLKDEQITAIRDRDGVIGINFYPYFVSSRQPAAMEDLLPHIEHFCTLGGAKHVGIGSDFDGVEVWTQGLEHPGCYDALGELLLKYYSADLVDGFLWGNLYRFYSGQLPEGTNNHLSENA